MNFDLENLKKLESKAEQLELDVKQLEAKKAELESVEADKKLQQIRDREARIEEKQWKKQKRKEELARKRDRLRNTEPERSFFARDQNGRNGIHKMGGFTFYAMIVTGIFSPVSIFVMSIITTNPDEVAELQTVRQYALFALIIPFGIIGWRNCKFIKLSTQFGFGILGSICLLYAVLSQIRGVDSGKQLNDALTPDSREKMQDKPSQD